MSSCQKEDIYQENKPNSLKVKEISFSKAKEIKILDNALTKVFEGIKRYNKNTGPVTDDDFTIDQSENVKVMSDGNSTTYTMLIKRAIESQEYFENLVIKINNDSQTKAYIFKYIPSEETHYVAIHNQLSFKGNFEVHEILYHSSVFQPLVNMGGCGKIALCDVGGETHDAGGNCTGIYYVLGNFDANAPDGGGGGNTPPYSAPVGGGSGGTVLQGNVLKMNNFITNLSLPKQDLFSTFPQATQDAIFNYLVANNFVNGSNTKVSSFLQSIISNNLTSYFTDNLTVTEITPDIEESINSMLNYLIQNNFSLQSTAFVNQLISSGISNNTVYTLDSSIDSTNGMIFNTMVDLNNYLNTPEPQTAPTSSITNSTTQQNEKVLLLSKSFNALMNFTVTVNQSKIAPFSISSVTSDFTGMTFGNTWTQNSFTWTANNDNTTTIHITGKRTVALFINGIGVIGTDILEFVITVNTTTGQVLTFFRVH